MQVAHPIDAQAAFRKSENLGGAIRGIYPQAAVAHEVELAINWSSLALATACPRFLTSTLV